MTTPVPDRKVAELQTMFPAVDVGVIELVLESCGGSQDRAIEQLLSMTDPSFKPDELESSRQEEVGLHRILGQVTPDTAVTSSQPG